MTERSAPAESESSEEIFGVQIAAARALLYLRHTNAIPLIEAAAVNSNPSMQERFLLTLSEFEKAVDREDDPEYTVALIELWHRLANRPQRVLRDYAVRQLLLAETAKYLLAHPELIEDPNRTIRREALWVAHSGPAPHPAGR